MTYNRIDKELDAPLQLRLQNSCKSKVFTFSLLFTLNTIIVPPPPSAPSYQMLFELRRWGFLEKCCSHLLSKFLMAEMIEVSHH